MRLNGRCLKASEHGAQQEQPSANPSRWVDWTELSVLHVTILAVQYPENTVHGIMYCLCMIVTSSELLQRCIKPTVLLEPLEFAAVVALPASSCCCKLHFKIACRLRCTCAESPSAMDHRTLALHKFALCRQKFFNAFFCTVMLWSWSLSSDLPTHS